jgi:type IV pilus assembly protein PilO
MSQIRTWYVGAVVGALIIVLAGWFLLISPKKGDADTLRDQTTAQEAQNAQLRGRIDTLKAAQPGVPQQDAGVAAVAVKIPGNPALPTLIRQLNALSATTDIEIESVVPAVPTNMDVDAPTFTGVAVGQPNAATSQLQFITVEINGQGSFYNLERFVKGLEDNPRAVLVTQVQMTDKATSAATGTGAAPTDTRALKLTVRVFRTAPLESPTPAPVAPAASK